MNATGISTGKPKTSGVSFDFVYTAIRVRDMAASMKFYTEILGMEIVEPLESTPFTKGQVVILRSPGGSQRLELNWYEPGSRFGSEYQNGEELDHLAFECDDVPTTVAELERKGVEVLVRSKEIGNWNEAFVKDPDGIWIELLPRKRAATPRSRNESIRASPRRLDGRPSRPMEDRDRHEDE